MVKGVCVTYIEHPNGHLLEDNVHAAVGSAEGVVDGIIAAPSTRGWRCSGCCGGGGGGGVSSGATPHGRCGGCG